MEMTDFEKRFVNREAKGRKNVERMRAALETLDSDSIQKVLEIGCGMGTVSAWLHDAFRWKVIGTDYDPNQVDLARKTHQENNSLRFQTEDASRLTFADESFDLVIAQNVFHHIPNWREALQQVARVLRPGGYFLWYDLVAPGWLAPAMRTVLRRSAGVYTQDEIARAFAEAGFETIRSQAVRHGPFRHYDAVFKKNWTQSPAAAR